MAGAIASPVVSSIKRKPDDTWLRHGQDIARRVSRQQWEIGDWMDDKRSKFDSLKYRGVFDYPCVRSKNLFVSDDEVANPPNTSKHVLGFMGWPGRGRAYSGNRNSARVLDQRGKWIYEWLKEKGGRTKESKMTPSVRAQKLPDWAQLGMDRASDRFDFGAPGHPCSVCLAAGAKFGSEDRHRHARRPGKPEFDIDKENLKPLNRPLREPVTPAWSHFHAGGDRVIDWWFDENGKHPADVEHPGKYVRGSGIAGMAIIEPLIGGKYKGSDLSKPFDSAATMARTAVRDPKRKDWDQKMHGWVHSQRRNLTYADMMGKERGRYPVGRQLAGHDLSWKVYNSAGKDGNVEDNGAAGHISARKAYKNWGGDPEHPEDLTTGQRPRVATSSSPEHQQFERIQRHLRRRIRQAPELFTVESMFGGKHGVLKIIPAGEYARIQYEQGALILRPSFKVLLKSLGLRFRVFSYGSANYICFAHGLTTPSEQWRNSGIKCDDHECEHNPGDCVEWERVPYFYSEHPDDEQLSDQDRQRVEKARHPYGALDNARYSEQTIKLGAGFADVNSLLKHYQKNASRSPESQKAWRGGMPWWQAAPAYPISGPDPLWPDSLMLAPVYGSGKFRERRWGGQLHDPAITVEGMQLVWLGSKNGCSVLGWENREPWQGITKDLFDIGVIHREPWESVDGLIWTEKWTEPYCVTCGHYLAQVDDPVHNGHNVYAKPQTRSYGRQILYPWEKDYERLINVTHIGDEEKWQEMVKHERESMAENLKAAEKLDLGNFRLSSKYRKYAQIFQDALVKKKTPEDVAKQTGMSADAVRTELSRLRHEEVEDLSDERWRQLLECKAPGIYTIATLERQPLRAYKIADLGADEHMILEGFDKAVRQLLTQRASKNRIPSINGNGPLYRKRARERGYDPLPDGELAYRSVYWQLAQELGEQMWRAWPGLNPITGSMQYTALSTAYGEFYESGIPEEG